MSFTWIPIYTELAEKLLEYRDRQNELLSMIGDLKKQGVKVIGTEDKDKQSRPVPLGEIDPFTFFANFNRSQSSGESRRRMLQSFKERLHLDSQVPDDFDGLPVAFPLGAWFFPYLADRQKDDVASLWDLALAVVKKPPQELNPVLFERCLEIKRVGLAKLTMGMFWLNSRNYVALDGNNAELFKRNGIDTNVDDMRGYLRLMGEVDEKLGRDYPKLSLDAWRQANQTKITAKHYWAGGFQWDEVSKLREFVDGNFWQIGWKPNNLSPTAKKTWQHFRDIAPGDEFAIKGYGGRNDLKIHYIGEVVSKTEDGVLKLRMLDRPLFKGKGPNGTNWFTTLTPVNDSATVDTIFHGAKRRVPEPDSSGNDSEMRTVNLVLYGPPGAGKTYQAIERAVRFIERGFSGEHGEYKFKFDELMREGRIAFITFHQSFSYEDFVEGIRPVLDLKSGEPRYECRPGIFKQFATEALFDCLRIDGTHNTNISYEDEKSERVQEFLKNADLSRLKPESQWKPYVLIVDEINRGNISKILGELITLIEPDKRVRQSESQNSLVVTLPYSGEKFAVPANLFLLATMNTADKSIALVDVALRRRFEFEEVPVDFRHCKLLSDKMRAVLTKLNERIALRKDRDHLIGHSYFMNVGNESDFNRKFRLHIVPLLQEYFHNDWEGLRYVLRENDQSDGGFICTFGDANDRGARNKWQWFFDAGIELNCLEILCRSYQIR